MSDTFKSGPRKGLPKQCECGGTLVYECGFGRIFSYCKRCTPVVKITVKRAR